MSKRAVNSALIVSLVISRFFNTSSNKALCTKDLVCKIKTIDLDAKSPDSIEYKIKLKPNLCCKENTNSVGGVETKDTPKIFLKYKGSKSNVCIRMCNIVELDCECIVNAANPYLIGGGGVDGAIHEAAGKNLEKACSNELERLGLFKLATGQAVLTDSFELKNKYKKTINHIIHTVGPNLQGREEKGPTTKDEQYLKNCYTNSLNLAKNNDIHSITFPAISTSIYKFPKDLAAKLSIEAVNEWLNENNEYNIKIIFSCFDKATYSAYKKATDNKNFLIG